MKKWFLEMHISKKNCIELPKVVIKDNFNDFLNGKVVEASRMAYGKDPIQPGEKIIAFKDSIAATTTVAVPREEQHRYIGIEGTVTEILSKSSANKNHEVLKVKKL